jgi:ABC-type multidrug transport system fused ATPase/permease subunit
MPDPPARRARASLGLARRLVALSLSYRWECALVFGFQVALLGLGVAGLGLSGVAVDVIRAELRPDAPAPRWPLDFAPPTTWDARETLLLLGVAVLGMAVVRALFNYGYSITVGKLVHLRLVPELRTRVFDKLQRLSFRFFDDNATGSIINRVTGDVQSLRSFVDGVLLQGLIMLLSLGVYLVYMLRTHVILTGVCLALTPLLWFITLRFSRAVRPGYQKTRELADRLLLTMSEAIRGMLVIKVFGREPEQKERFREHNVELKNQQRAVFRRVSRFGPTVSLLSQLNVAVLLSYGGTLVVRGVLSLGELIVFAGLLQQFSAQVASMAVIVNTLQQSLTGAERVFDVLDAPLEVASPRAAAQPEGLEGRIRFEQVSFRYGESDVLRELDFEIRPGECVAILGATGSGKSTLLGLIPRFFDATAGRVLVGGHDVRDLDLDFLRRKVGLVFQESLLFRASVAENIAFGTPEASRERIERAARIAGAHGFVSGLPRGYDTELEEGAQNLSGGQRQRLAIARAILADPPLLLLDDPTAAVDTRTEAEVLEAIDAAREGRTTLIIANRLATLARADRILVLHEGKLVESGTHAELVKLRGIYYRAAALQAADTESLHLLRGSEAPA